MRVCLFEDSGALHLEPLSLTRPVYELYCGQTTLGQKQCRYFAPCELGVLIRPALVELCQLRQPSLRVNDLAWLRAEPTVLVNARWLPPAGVAVDLAGPSVAVVGEEIAYAIVGADRLPYLSDNTIGECLDVWKQTLPHRDAGGTLIAHPWDLVHHNVDQLVQDFHQNIARYRTGWHPREVAVVGPPERLFLDPTVRVDPMVVIDTTRGPVMIDREAVVTAFTRIEGPAYIGPETHLLGAKIRAGTTLGPQCRIGGEVEASIVQGHSNKYHDGFLGHSYVGEWVNLAAGTQNSDLRNDYGQVSVVVGGEIVNTGQTKVGCFLGDHTKTGLGTLLNTGTSAGVFCNLLPSGGYLPRRIPSFCFWWKGALRENADLSQQLATAETVLQRRGAVFTDVHARFFRSLFYASADERRAALREAEQRRLRRSA
jgi:UDP-N-acetylglucosamine diphosphorylase/glucosamine-1-phosphate N-acetyltransferase